MLVSAAPTARPSSQDTEPSLLSGVGDTVKDTKGSVDGVVASTLAGATGVRKSLGIMEQGMNTNK